MMELVFVGGGLLLGLLVAWLTGFLVGDSDYGEITTAYIVKKNSKFKVTPKRIKLRFPHGVHNFELRPGDEDIRIEIKFEKKKKKGNIKQGPFLPKDSEEPGSYKLDRSKPREENLQLDPDVDPGAWPDDWDYTVKDLSNNDKIDPGIRIKK